MTKKILILSFYYPPDLCAGSFRTQALIESLLPIAIENNMKIDVITTQPNRYADFQLRAAHLETIQCVTIYRIAIPAHHSGFLDQAKAFVVYFFKTLKISKNNHYDLIYATSSRLFTAFLGARIAAKKRKPLFLDMRDIFTDTMESLLQFPLKLFLPFFYFIERYTLKKATALNVVSKGFLPHFSTKNNYKTFTYSNGIDRCFYNTNYHQPDKNRRIKQILYAGNIGQGQGIEKIIPVLAQAFYTQCEFHVIGNGGQLNQLKKASVGINNITILSPMSRSELIQHYKNADILFLHLNDCTAFEKVLPSKIFEYAITGKPILAGVSGYAADFLRDHVSGSWVFSPCNIKQAISQLHAILKNEMQPIDREYFYQEFNREKLMNALASHVVSFCNYGKFE